MNAGTDTSGEAVWSSVSASIKMWSTWAIVICKMPAGPSLFHNKRDVADAEFFTRFGPPRRALWSSSMAVLSSRRPSRSFAVSFPNSTVSTMPGSSGNLPPLRQ